MFGTFTGWKTETFAHGITLELRLIPWGASKAFLRKVNGFLRQIKTHQQDEDRDIETFIDSIDQSLDEKWLREECFAKFVRGRDEKGALVDGGAVFDELPIGLVIAVLYKLAALAQVSADEGKGSSSSSPSTSPETTSTPGESVSAATSTGEGDGPRP